MKKFLQSLPQVLVNLCVSYTCAVLLYTLLDAQQATMRRAWLYEILAICAAAMLAVVCGAAGVFRWVPLEQLGSWLWLVGIFLVGFAAITLVFEGWFRLKRRVYDDALGRYKQRKK